MSQTDQIIADARSYLGVRWLHQGRTRAGIDCVGLVIEVSKAVLGWSFDVTGYPRHAKDETMLDTCRQRMVEVRRSQVLPGDVLVMAFAHQRHMAIVGGEPGALTVIHAYVVNRQVVEQRLDAPWMARVVGCFRFPEVSA